VRLALRRDRELRCLFDAVVAAGSGTVGERDIELEPALDERKALDVEADVGVLAAPIPPELTKIPLRPAERSAGSSSPARSS
jgi:hypothetical protein